jgi:hypothetical protein
MAMPLGYQQETPEERLQRMYAEAMRSKQGIGQPDPIAMKSQVEKTLNPSGMAASGFVEDAPEQGGSIEGRQRISDSQRDYANQLRGKGMPQGKTVGPLDVYVGPNWAESLEGAVNQGLGGYMAGKANREDRAIDKERQLEKTILKEETDAEKARVAGIDAEKLQLLQNADDRAGKEVDRDYTEFTDGNDVLRGYVDKGIGYTEDGERLSDGFSEVQNKSGTSGLGGRAYISKMTDPQGNDVHVKIDPYSDAPPQYLVLGTDGKPSKWSTDAAEAGASTRSRVDADKAVEKESGVAGVKSNQSRIDGLNEEIPALQKQLSGYSDAIEAVASGANTGPFAGRIPSFTDASTWLDNIQQEQGLAKIALYTFGSLSEAEGNWVKDSSIPKNMSEEYLSDFLRAKAEGANRLLKARQFEREYREEFGRRPKDAMVDKILYEGDFKFGARPEWMKDAEK